MKKTDTYAALTDAAMPWEEAHRQLAYRMALEGIVLLENDGVLPTAPGKVALFGAGARYTVKGGTGSGEVNERFSVSIEEGLEQAGFTVTTKSWLDRYDIMYRTARDQYGRRVQENFSKFRISEMMNIMKDPFCGPVGQEITPEDLASADTELCIYVVARQAGEGGDRSPEGMAYRLTEEEKAQIGLCASHFSRMILVLNVGGVFDLNHGIEGINAVVFFCQQGGMGGPALADLLRGVHSPSGRLTSTWPARYDDIPFAREFGSLDGCPDQADYREGIYVGYRYFDTFGVAPQYPFGYGLSYTTFSQKLQEISVEGQNVHLHIHVVNTGSRAGKETVQLYAACPQSAALPKERKRLVAFGKTGVLQPGEGETLGLCFETVDLASYRETDHATVLEQGDYVLMLGQNALQTESVAAVRMEREQVLFQHKPMCVLVRQIQELTAPALKNESVEGLPVVCPEVAQTVRYSYAEPEDVSCVLSLGQQLSLCVGGGMFGSRAFDAPGAAGVTTARLLKKGIPQVVLADGPAGLRLQKRSVRLKNGVIKPVEQAMEVMRYMPRWIQRFMTAEPEQGQMLYQFTTAFPVEMAVAQSWNTGLAREVGQAISEEMSAYGVKYWLAPAMNIHRNPLCGRNYEYYSEDPLLTGLFAVAVTKGVQSQPGNMVTLKHFACNNQEENRNRMSSNLNQRALREIYLRGFEIAVRKAHPGAIMSSYNRVNGVYTPNSHDLLTGILRGEWGFEGLVMTDWFSTGPGLASDARCIAAGNDLVMPGFFFNRWAILWGLLTGKCTRKDLARSAERIRKAIQ